MSLSNAQKEIIETEGNLIVKASAGTGKTYTLVSKIENDLEKEKSHKTIAAITFTIKAANELKQRLTHPDNFCFIGTNNMFVIEEIIKPFLKDYLGSNWNFDLTVDYNLKFESYDEGMDVLFKKQILGSLKDNKQNFIFQLAKNIVLNSKACRLFLKSKYFKIYIDEYQDCDKDMHDFFMYLCDNLQICTFIVGDEKQSIYMWRGAYPQAFINISKKTNFITKYLRENYRSCLQIQNYSNLLCPDTQNLYVKIEDLSNVLFVCTTKSQWNKKIKSLIDLNKNLAVLRSKNSDAKLCSEILTNDGIDTTFIPQTPIDDIATESAWMYRAIAEYAIVEKFSIYDFNSIIPNFIENKNSLITINDLLIRLNENTANKNVFERLIFDLSNMLDYPVKTEDINKLYETINSDDYLPAFDENLTNVAMTVHSSKGLEFEQVVLFANDFNLSDINQIYNHYVASTRAKQKLIIVYNQDEYWSKNFLYIKDIFGQVNLSIRDVVTVVS